MAKIYNVCVLDIETTNSIEEPIPYDIGWAIVEIHESEAGVTYKPLLTRSYVVAETWIHYKELLKSAYYAEKLPQYYNDLKNGSRKLARIENISKVLKRDCRKYGAVAISAHNANFDKRGCTKGIRYLTKSMNRWFFPYGIEMWDTLKMARNTFYRDDDYIDFCESHEDFTCKNGRPRLTAEILYRYITGNLTFEESHTGLEDVLIEADILCECLKKNRDVERLLKR